jgi:hypothetical protein
MDIFAFVAALLYNARARTSQTPGWFHPVLPPGLLLLMQLQLQQAPHSTAKP